MCYDNYDSSYLIYQAMTIPKAHPMHVFENAFLVLAPLSAVAAFHQDPAALKRLSPPLVRTQIHSTQPIAEGSRTEFTLWFGPFPVRWLAVHSQVDPLHGFTDKQEKGPLAYWQHTHSFDPIDARTTRVRDQIQYAYPTSGWPGIYTRVLFNPVALRLLFAHRARVTQKSVSLRT
jgi:ligand-binding SRPBCC domain-containing protein